MESLRGSKMAGSMHSNRWSTHNKLNSIFGGSLFCQSFFFLNIAGSLLMYFGFWFCVFMMVLGVKMCVSLYSYRFLVPILWLFFFCLLVFSYSYFLFYPFNFIISSVSVSFPILIYFIIQIIF